MRGNITIDGIPVRSRQEVVDAIDAALIASGSKHPPDYAAMARKVGNGITAERMKEIHESNWGAEPEELCAIAQAFGVVNFAIRSDDPFVLYVVLRNKSFSVRWSDGHDHSQEFNLVGARGDKSAFLIQMAEVMELSGDDLVPKKEHIKNTVVLVSGTARQACDLCIKGCSTERKAPWDHDLLTHERPVVTILVVTPFGTSSAHLEEPPTTSITALGKRSVLLHCTAKVLSTVAGARREE